MFNGHIISYVLLQIVQQFILSVLVWSPIEQFSNVRYSCPKCTEAENSYLIPTTWTNGHVHHPRLIHDVHSNVSLFSRVYCCKNGHEVYGHYPQLLEHEILCDPPFLLWHSTDFTLMLLDHIQHLVCSGVSMQECERNLQQNRVINFYRIHRKLILSSSEQSANIPNIDDVPIWKTHQQGILYLDVFCTCSGKTKELMIIK